MKDLAVNLKHFPDQTDNSKNNEYVSGIVKYNKTNGEPSLIMAPFIEGFIRDEETKKRNQGLLEQVKKTLAWAKFTSRYLTKCMFNEEIYEEEYLLHNKTYGWDSIYGFGTRSGDIIFAPENELLFHYLNFEFMIENELIPYEFVWKNEHDRAKYLSNVNVKRSSGKITNGIVNFNHTSIRFKDNDAYVYVDFNENISDPPLVHTKDKTNTYWKIIPTQFGKAVLLNEFLIQNPEIKFHILFENPLKKYSHVYEKYVLGNKDLEKQYAELNKYYSEKLEEYTEKVIVPAFEKHMKPDQYVIEIYNV